MLKRPWLQLLQVVDGDHGVLVVVIGLEPGHVGDSPLPFTHPTGCGRGFATASTPAINDARNERPATVGSEFNGLVMHS